MLILLPTTAKKLTAEWQGPYCITKGVGKVDYKIHLHVIVLRKWYAHDSGASAYFCEEVRESKDDIPVLWDDDDDQTSMINDAMVAIRLNENKRTELWRLLRGVCRCFSECA